MKTSKQLGIWMDHSKAHLIEFENEATVTNNVIAQVGEQDEPLNKLDESMIQNKEQNQLSAFFKKLGEVIIKYDEVLLFGPTNAKAELFNELKNDLHFDQIKIEMKTTDQMTENQMQAFVKEFFS